MVYLIKLYLIIPCMKLSRRISIVAITIIMIGAPFLFVRVATAAKLLNCKGNQKCLFKNATACSPATAKLIIPKTTITGNKEVDQFTFSILGNKKNFLILGKKQNGCNFSYQKTVKYTFLSPIISSKNKTQAQLTTDWEKQDSIPTRLCLGKNGKEVTSFLNEVIDGPSSGSFSQCGTSETNNTPDCLFLPSGIMCKGK